MAFFRNISPSLARACERTGPCHINRQFSEFVRGSGLTSSNKSQFSSVFSKGRHPTSLVNRALPLDNIVATSSLILQSRSLIKPISIFPQGKFCSRGFQSSSSHQQNQKDDNKTPTFGEQMSLRLINENGFLSWTRNSYLSAAVGATMLNGANVEVTQHAGILVLVVSAMNMTWGSACHFTNLLRIRDRCAMSRPTLFLNLLGCVIHALLWLFILGYYIHFSGYTGWVRHRRQQRKDMKRKDMNRLADKQQ